MDKSSKKYENDRSLTFLKVNGVFSRTGSKCVFNYCQDDNISITPAYLYSYFFEWARFHWFKQHHNCTYTCIYRERISLPTAMDGRTAPRTVAMYTSRGGGAWGAS